jgi:methyltransferase family protein
MSDTFAGDVALRYDAATAHIPVEPVVDFLLPLAGGGALELAIGTGRIAVPLAARGVDITGIDLTPDMVAQLRLKSETIPVALGDMTTTRVDGTFSLVYLVFNTIVNLTTQEAQVACFRNAAAHLVPGGCFVIEADLLPDEARNVFALTDGYVGIDAYDAATQQFVTSHFRLLEDGSWERSSVPCRAVSPAELDLMARCAGLELRERWGDWDRCPFTAESTKHVSVWEKK